MKIKFVKNDFLESLNVVSKALSRRTTYPILECILIDASNDNIVLTCTDQEISIEKITAGTILEKGKAAINGNILLQIIRNMPDDVDITLEVNENLECTIFCKNTKQTFLTKDAKEYPVIREVSKENKIIINERKLNRIINKTAFCYEKLNKSDNIILKGIYFKIENNEITAKSMDGYTLAIIKDILNNKYDPYEVIIPGRTLEEINKLIKGELSKDVYIYINDKYIAFEFNNTMFTSNIIANKYIDTDRIINVECQTMVAINRQEFIDCLERSRVFTNEEEKKPVIFDITDDTMTINLFSIIGESNDKIDIKKTGKDLHIAFNPNSLINILNTIEDETVYLHFSGTKQPIIIKDKQETYIYLSTAVNI